MKCIHKNCTRQAAIGKFYCNKHLHGQRQVNPVNGLGTSYGKMSKKEIAKRTKNKTDE